MSITYCIHCRIANNLPVFIADDYMDYVCDVHKDKPMTMPDARDLNYIDDGVDLEAEQREIEEEMQDSYDALCATAGNRKKYVDTEPSPRRNALHFK